MSRDLIISNNHVKVSSILTSVMVFMILINNFVYQTDLQINQIILNIFVLSSLISIIFCKKKIKKNVIFLVGLLVILVMIGVYSSDSLFERNRVVYASLIFLTYIILAYVSKYIVISENLFFICAFIIFITAMSILVIGDRHIINPNWYAMTFFYILVLSPYRERIYLYCIALLGSYFIFESRGASVSFFSAILVIVFAKRFYKFTKFTIAFVIISLCAMYFVFLDFYFNNTVLVSEFFNNNYERALGGRDAALLMGYQILHETNYLGEGIGESGGYEFEYHGSIIIIHIYYGLLELALKLSIFFPILLLILFPFYINKIDYSYLPAVAGGLMTVFYYNGLGPSHLGLNYFLIIALSQAYYFKRNSSCTYYRKVFL